MPAQAGMQKSLNFLTVMLFPGYRVPVYAGTTKWFFSDLS